MYVSVVAMVCQSSVCISWHHSTSRSVTCTKLIWATRASFSSNLAGHFSGCEYETNNGLSNSMIGLDNSGLIWWPFDLLELFRAVPVHIALLLLTPVRAPPCLPFRYVGDSNFAGEATSLCNASKTNIKPAFAVRIVNYSSSPCGLHPLC